MLSENDRLFSESCDIIELKEGVEVNETNDFLYEAFKAKDARFDGRFFVGISSTGIYCRPVCRAKMAKAENCEFFTSAAEAERSGYRPCLLCRPELAPGSSAADTSSSLAYSAARLIEENCGTGENLPEIAEKLGCSGRHLRRVFETEFHVTPVEYLQTCRLLLAKNLLTDTDLSVLDTAMAAGFGSLRRMNALFQKRYGLSPTGLRKSTANGKMHTDGVTVALGYRPPYLWDKILDFLAQRAIQGVEAVADGVYSRTVRIDVNGKTLTGIVSVKPGNKMDTLAVTVSGKLLSALPRILTRIKHLFDLYCDPDSVYDALRDMNSIRQELCIKGTRMPGCFEPFETSVRAVLGQQITVKAASTLAGRIAEKFGEPLEEASNGLLYTFPTAERISALGDDIVEQFGALGVIASRSNAILELARAITSGAVNLSVYADPLIEIAKLKKIKGIGDWTANYIAMRTMGYTDAFLETDIGIKHALPGYTPNELVSLSEKWRPWRSYAVVNLWNTL